MAVANHVGPRALSPGLPRPNPWTLALGVVWLAAFVAGLAGLAERLSNGHQAADYGSYLTWGLWVAVYQYLIEMAAGAFLIAAAISLLRIRPMERFVPASLLLAITSLLAGILTVWVDLGRMERFWRVIFYPNWSSIIAWVVVAYTAFLIVAAVALWFSLRAPLAERASGHGWRASVAKLLLFGRRDTSSAARARDMKVVRVLLVIGLLPAIGFSGGEGALFGVVGSRAYWNSPIFPIAFLASAIVTAGAVLTVLGAFFLPGRARTNGHGVVFLARLTLGALLALLVLEFAQYSVGLYGSIPAQQDAYEEILQGRYWWNFWILHLVGGAAIPLAIFALRSASPRWLTGASFLAGAGMFSVRLNAVIPGQVLPQLEGIERAFADPRLTFDYFPSPMEWLVSLFVASVGVLLFYAGYQLLPIGAPAEAEEPHPAALQGGE
ncbi:MAG: polysulfide reductase NrfD [Chloroflexi bacterium]|nr:polysulfide reductase NrfD [Chloroflexota bacterium]